ncbi:hypothetical protein F5B22DRAFT_525690 [Xylaria bambusicola]|uniref:uncharacterized protein n=1 Tax=Xylaria bambusicola TaxID=326684 RepID=UPI002007622C|nr:uncharacterized protein F5B22DRAFT_525690 [Xylaria bambusicola]KAI0505475.1 hypothetical protein F5B22DRAFT_525690 [Xylaria bambusicola]
MRRASVLFVILQSASFQTLNYLLVEYVALDSFWNRMKQDPMFQEYDRVSQALWDAKHGNQTRAQTDKTNTGQTARLELPASDSDETDEGTFSVQPIIDVTHDVEHQSEGPESRAEPEVHLASVPTQQAKDKTWRTAVLDCLRVFFIQLFLGPLLYAWHIWLERLFPTRRSARQDKVYTDAKQKDADITFAEDTREEQVIQKWLRQGKIRRASLSWPNTFAKWALQWTIGRYWTDNARELLDALLRRQSLSKSLFMPTTYVFYWFTRRLTAAPLCTMLSFLMVPASKRLSFMSGVTLLWNALLVLMLNLLAPRVIQTEWVQGYLFNMTEEIKIESQGFAHPLDEL